MAKKRKTTARKEEPSEGVQLDPGESRKRIRTYEDVADSDDEFHLNNDKIRLREEPNAKRRRQRAEREEFLEPSDEEVLGYSEDEESASDASPVGRATHSGARLENGSDSGDETRVRDHEEGEELGWGTSKADLYGADAIETEEQALEEEAEALRLQKKQLESMQAADYGFDESDWQQGDTKADNTVDERDAVVTEVLPQLQIAPDMGPAERLKLLKSRYPEFELLSKDLLDLQDIHTELSLAAESSPVARIKLRTASAYMGALAMYFSLFASNASGGGGTVTAMSAAQLRDHPVMDSLVKCRELWTNVRLLTDVMPLTDEESDSDVELEDHHEHGGSVSLGALAVQSQPVKKSRAERHAQAARAAKEERKAERLRRTEADLAGLDSLLATNKTRTSTRPSIANDMIDGNDSELGEEVPLSKREADDKAKRKKSLRFYTSQIAQKANKRGAAGRNAGGDDDIPHRERLRDRQARLNAEAAKRGKQRDEIGDDLGGESDEDDRRQAQEIRADADEGDYYDLVAARSSKKKSEKAALAEAQRQAALQNGHVVQEENVGVDGKRKISYLIEKNKGLTPHRKKDVRNPRVKKKKKYEEKKKKLASIKPVYKGGEGRGGYGGELTGIKKGLVKSTKL